MLENFMKAPERKRQLIIETSTDVFIRHGYVQANTIEIAKACGVAKGSLFHYFGSKQGLFLYVVKLSADRIMVETRKVLSQIKGGNFFDRMRKSIEFKAALPARFPRETALLARAFAERGHEAEAELRSISTEYASQMRDLNRLYLGEVERELVRDGVVFEDAKVFVQTVLDGTTSRILAQHAQNPQLLLDNPALLRAELDKAIQFILHGIGKGEEVS